MGKLNIVVFRMKLMDEAEGAGGQMDAGSMTSNRTSPRQLATNQRPIWGR